MIDLNEIQSRLTTFNAGQAALSNLNEPEAEQAEIETFPEVAESQNQDSVKNQVEEELAEWRNRCAGLAVERELALALSGQALLPGVTNQLMRLMREKVVAEPDGSKGFQVKATDGRSLADAVKDWLLSPEYSHFRVAASRGGTAIRSETSATDRSVPTSAAPKNLNEIVIQQWRQRASRPGISDASVAWPYH